MAERWIYQKKNGDIQIREYIRQDVYLDVYPSATVEKFSKLYGESGKGWPHCWQCKASTMKAWGVRITLQQAIALIPDYDSIIAAGTACYNERLEIAQQEDSKMSHDLSLVLLSAYSNDDLLAELRRRMKED